MTKKLFTLALLTLALGAALSTPAPAAYTCSCFVCEQHPTSYCYDRFNQRWDCDDYLWERCF